MVRRIWSEMLPYAEVRDSRVLDLLRARSIGLLLAARPGDHVAVRDTLAACADAGVSTGVWPMLDDDDGRWASARNVGPFCSFVRDFVEKLGDRAPAELVVNLEPGIEEVRALLHARRGAGRLFAVAADTVTYGNAAHDYAKLARDLRGAGIKPTAVAVPLVLLGSEWERILGTPVEAPGWDAISVMLYTTILEGWSKGLLGRDDAVGILAAGCRATAAHFGGRAGVSLGTVGTGAFGDEPIYRSPAELARDVAVARACGVDDLTLFDLAGVLRRAPAEAWLDALVETPAATGASHETLRGRAAFSIAELAARSIGAIASLSRLRSGLRT